MKHRSGICQSVRPSVQWLMRHSMVIPASVRFGPVVRRPIHLFNYSLIHRLRVSQVSSNFTRNFFMYPANKQTDGNKQTQKAVINRTVTKWRGLSTHRRVRSYLLQRSSNLLLIIVRTVYLRKKQHRCTYHGNVSVKCRGVVRRPEAVQRRPTENSATKTQKGACAVRCVDETQVGSIRSL